MSLKLTASIAALGLSLLAATAAPVHQAGASIRLAVVSHTSPSGDVTSMSAAFGQPATPRLGRARRLDALSTGTSWGTGASLKSMRVTTWSQFLIGS